MTVNEVYIIAAEGCKVRAKVDGFWSGRHPLLGRTIDDFEEWTIEQIAAAENPPETKRTQYETACVTHLREHYTEDQERAIQNNFALANYHLATNVVLSTEDEQAIADMTTFINCREECKCEAHVEVYGEE